MKIAVNVWSLVKRHLEGVGGFTYHTLKKIVREHPEHEFHFLFDRPVDPDFIFAPNIIPHVIPPPGRHPILWFIRFEITLPKFLKQLQFDLFLATDGFLPLRSSVRTLAVIHDIAFEHLPQDVRPMHGAYYRRYFPRFVRAADRIATVSEYSKQDIVSTYGADPSTIDVVYNGASESFVPLDSDKQQQIRERLTGGVPYFIYVGALHQRKNIIRLLQAFDMARREIGEIKLVIVGRNAWGNREMFKTYESMCFKNDVIFTGRISEEDLANTMASALALTYVSYFEGFGIPLLEAMQCNVPVITSNRTALAETAGDAAILVDPYSVSEIAEAMSRIATDADLRKTLSARGTERAQEYSWDRTAYLLWESIEKTVRQ